jgi:hypothetical protein
VNVLKNLLFYCYPVRGTVWSWHIPRLLEHRRVFTGRKLVAVAIDEKTENPSVVLRTFAPLEAEITFVENDEKKGETAHFVNLLGLLKSEKDDEATFYAHAKGVTRHGQELNGVLNWSWLMYEAALRFPALVEQKLREKAIVGSLRYDHVAPRKGWCYAGTFFWLKHSALFRRDWRRIDDTFYGVEDYPGVQFKPDEGYCLTPSSPSPSDLYAGAITRDFIEKTVEELSKENKKCIRA